MLCRQFFNFLLPCPPLCSSTSSPPFLSPSRSLLRRHPSPSRERFESLIAAAASRGFSLCVDDSSELQQSLDASVDKDDPNINKIIRILATRCVGSLFAFPSVLTVRGVACHVGALSDLLVLRTRVVFPMTSPVPLETVRLPNGRSPNALFAFPF